jgi:hypothetical protein
MPDGAANDDAAANIRAVARAQYASRERDVRAGEHNAGERPVYGVDVLRTANRDGDGYIPAARSITQGRRVLP